MLYELINPSDPYTFRAPSLEVAGVCSVLLSTCYGARPIDSDSDETTPIMFGWSEWLEDRKIDDAWIDAHADEIAATYDSFLIGSASERADLESMLAIIPDDKRKEWRAERQDKHRSSLNQIGERAYRLASKFRAIAETKPQVTACVVPGQRFG